MFNVAYNIKKLFRRVLYTPKKNLMNGLIKKIKNTFMNILFSLCKVFKYNYILFNSI